jgi:hypothetical protein
MSLPNVSFKILRICFIFEVTTLDILSSMEQTITIRTAKLTFSEGILYIRIFEEADMDRADVEEIYNLGLQMAQGKPYCALADTRGKPTSTPEARAFGAEQGYSKFRLADALLVDSSMMKLVANVYIKFNKPKVPTRMFESEEKAIAWLRTFL